MAMLILELPSSLDLQDVIPKNAIDYCTVLELYYNPVGYKKGYRITFPPIFYMQLLAAKMANEPNLIFSLINLGVASVSSVKYIAVSCKLGLAQAGFECPHYIYSYYLLSMEDFK